MAKINDSVWSVFAQSISLYFNNFGSFFKYMAFPVLGQLFGVLLSLAAAFFYAQNLPKWIVQGGLFDNFSVIFIVLILLVLPGLLIFAKAFWDYLVAYGAINSMLENMLKSGKVYDFPAHTELITRRTASFVGVWLLMGLLAIIGSFPLFWVVAGIMFVYFVLVFQVFTFEPQKNPLECFQKSVSIIKGNFARTVGLMALLGGLTYWLLPEIIKFVLGFINIIAFFTIPVDVWVQQLPIDEINKMLIQFKIYNQLTSLMIANFIVSSTIGTIVILFTLPLRSLCWALWYKALNKGEVKLDKKILDRATKD